MTYLEFVTKTKLKWVNDKAYLASTGLFLLVVWLCGATTFTFSCLHRWLLRDIELYLNQIALKHKDNLITVPAPLLHKDVVSHLIAGSVEGDSPTAMMQV